MELDYRIAGLTVRMDTFGRTLEQAAPYRAEFLGAPDITIRADWRPLKQSQPHLSEEDCEYLVSGSAFYLRLLDFDGLLLHASAVEMDGRAYLFTAPCGTGKSTHAALWRQVYGDRRVYIINDDKPALRLENGQWFVYGTPWSGKTAQNLNLRVPLGGICSLRQGPVNRIESFGGVQAIFAILEQTLRPRDAQLRLRLLELLDRLLTQTPVWQMECTMDPEAARLSYETMSRTKRGGL